MIDKRHLVQWVRATLAVLVGLALLVAPMASLRAMPDHDLVRHEHAIVDQGAQLGANWHHAGCPRDTVDHKVCCGSACGFCVAAIDTASATLLDLAAARQQYEQVNQFINGVLFPPLLGPPRSQA